MIPSTEPITAVRHDSEPTASVGVNGVGPGTRLLNGKFELQQLLGSGGMGVVYQALDLDAVGLQDPRPRLALKILKKEVLQAQPDARIALQRELSRTRRLSHPHIVRVYEFYEDQGLSFITMELLEGRSWEALIGANPRGMPLREARPLIEQLCAALTYAHGQRVVHSDLKPQNLFQTRDQQVKVLDFGIAAQTLGPRTSEPASETLYNPRQKPLLSALYACPEMWCGLDADPRDDVYSTACIVYELLSGLPPYGRVNAIEALSRKLTPAPIGSLTRAQNEALRHALELSREARTATIEAFASELWGSDDPDSPRVRPRRWISALGGATAASALAAAAFLLHPAPPRPMGDTVSGEAALGLWQQLHLKSPPFQPGRRYARDAILAAVARSPREAVLGSSTDQIQAALALCQASSSDCRLDDYADEKRRTVHLTPFRLDPAAVTVAQFRPFIESTHHTTTAERTGKAYALQDGVPRPISGGNWRNAVRNNGQGGALPADDSAVVAVSFSDAEAFCRWRGARLPTEDEWEYTARGPAGSIFPWGDDPAPARVRTTQRPAAADGPAEGVDGSLRGLSGNVWEWVDTPGQGGPSRKTLKGGSWLEQSAANRRSAARRSEVADSADSDSGFRCAISLDEWPDALFWIKGLR
jgi:serine/threonine protein kinase